MKLFLKRDGGGFLVLDKSGHEKYTVSVLSGTKQKITVEAPDHTILSTIANKNMVLRYFSIKCSGRLYVLVPCMGERFAFVIYGASALLLVTVFYHDQAGERDFTPIYIVLVFIFQ